MWRALQVGTAFLAIHSLSKRQLALTGREEPTRHCQLARWTTASTSLWHILIKSWQKLQTQKDILRQDPKGENKAVLHIFTEVTLQCIAQHELYWCTTEERWGSNIDFQGPGAATNIVRMNESCQADSCWHAPHNLSRCFQIRRVSIYL